MKRFFIRSLYVLLTIIIALGVSGWAYVQGDKFGPSVDAIHSDAVLSSPNYVDGEFHNLVETPLFAEDVSFPEMVWRNMTAERPDDLRPKSPLPSEKVDLRALDPEKDIVIWLGHSGFYIQLAGKRILIDPVFSTFAAPVPVTNQAFEGTTPYTAEDMPEIDYLLISHEHWDHLDYDTVTALRPKVRNAVAGIGLVSYFKLWGYPEESIHALDWNDKLEGEDITIHALPARHYSRRLLASNQTLWTGYALVSDKKKLFFSGDTGYGPHLAEIGARFGGFDLVSLDNGQYNTIWPYIHMTPEEAVKAAEDLHARAFIPGHVGKFSLSNHSWKDPFVRLAEASKGKSFRLMTPLIGAPVDLDDQNQTFTAWWEGIE